ncbi:hypothetical protein XPA_000650 [Xanthoria parietina]
MDLNVLFTVVSVRYAPRPNNGAQAKLRNLTHRLTMPKFSRNAGQATEQILLQPLFPWMYSDNSSNLFIDVACRAPGDDMYRFCKLTSPKSDAYIFLPAMSLLIRSPGFSTQTSPTFAE